jgi:hypothetical protein
MVVLDLVEHQDQAVQVVLAVLMVYQVVRFITLMNQKLKHHIKNLHLQQQPQ